MAGIVCTVNFISMTEASTVAIDLVCTILTTFYHMHRYSYAATGDKQRRLVTIFADIIIMHYIQCIVFADSAG